MVSLCAMRRVLEAVSPSRMGGDFRVLLGSSWLTNLGDGIALSAGALLVESQTSSASLVALSWVLQRLPWLLFGLHAGAVADRLDRRLIIVAANLCRIVLLMALAIAIGAGVVNLGLVFTVLFLLGSAEVFADNTTDTLLPMLVEKADIGIGNSRLIFGHTALNQLAGPAFGGLLFAAGVWIPFVAQAVLVTFGAILVWRLRTVSRQRTVGGSEVSRSVTFEIVEGFRWLRTHPAMRTLVLTILAFNLTFGAAWAVLVVLATDRLSLGPAGFGLLTSVSAAGAVVGAASYGRLERSVSLANLMRAGLIIETATHLGLAVTTVAWQAMTILFVFGAHTSIWGTTVRSVRQRSVPMNFQGRVGSVYSFAMQGGLVFGALAGSVIAGIWGVTGPFWFAFVGSALILVVIWRELGHITHAEVTAG